ncbi:MAG TPA: L-lactate dehydrogenase [Ruminococcaceae bacterium]|nr:L-lactate dehydrogenase [Oscillospiraceae bacterium]HAY97843.1 L-lactate dehydrogenase [Oscillospiraceae bacterium]HBJ10589.1 L-lactate dehydrogenase [Oscillospiraceae bacterium]HCD81486.1 L-lactate dehydrogenase [Oscillospiraceae bacterium]
MNKVSIIGTGSVGSTIAYTLTVMGLASEIVMIDINNEKALGEALDIRQGTPFCGACSIYAGDYRDAVNSDIVIVTSGIARKPGQSRLELAQTNVNITKQIIPEITKYAPDATYIIVSNPVDILTYTFYKMSGLPENRIIGSGTILDTARLRSRLSEYYNINQSNVHAYVFGEHGDSSFIPWSVANISNVPIKECKKLITTPGINTPELDFGEIEQYVRKSGARVIARKGATFYAVSVSVCHICKCLLGGIDTTMTVSTMMHGEYGIENVALSTLNMVGHEGVRGKVNVPMTDEEVMLLRKSADTLKDVISNLEI